MKKMITMAMLAMAAMSLTATDWMRGIAVDGKVRFAPDKTAQGYLPILDECPHPIGTNYTIAVDHWTNRYGRCECVYKQVELPPEAPAPKVYSRYKAYLALRGAGVWPQVKAWIEANDLWDAFIIANDFRDDDPNFKLGVEQLKKVVGWSDEQVTALLEQCVADKADEGLKREGN